MKSFSRWLVSVKAPPTALQHFHQLHRTASDPAEFNQSDIKRRWNRRRSEARRLTSACCSPRCCEPPCCTAARPERDTPPLDPSGLRREEASSRQSLWPTRPVRTDTASCRSKTDNRAGDNRVWDFIQLFFYIWISAKERERARERKSFAFPDFFLSHCLKVASFLTHILWVLPFSFRPWIFFFPFSAMSSLLGLFFSSCSMFLLSFLNLSFFNISFLLSFLPLYIVYYSVLVYVLSHLSFLASFLHAVLYFFMSSIFMFFHCYILM